MGENGEIDVAKVQRSPLYQAAVLRTAMFQENEALMNWMRMMGPAAQMAAMAMQSQQSMSQGLNLNPGTSNQQQQQSGNGKKVEKKKKKQ